MSMHFKIHGEPEEKVYDDGRTKQAFKDETDINVILGRYRKTGVVSHLNKFQPMYGEFSEFDFAEADAMLAKGDEIFAALPSEVRAEFDQNVSSFFAFVNDPNNVDRIGELLPEIAKKGTYFPDVSSDTPPGDLLQGGEPGGVTIEQIREAFQVKPKEEKPNED